MSSQHDSHESQQEVRKATYLAILIIAALGVAIALFVHRSSPAQAEEETATTPRAPGASKVTHIPSSRAELVRGIRNRDRLNPRVAYARELHGKLRAKGQTCSISTAGEMGRDLVVSWTRQNHDRVHMEQLQNARGFLEILRSKRFENLIMKVDDKVIWSKRL